MIIKERELLWEKENIRNVDNVSIEIDYEDDCQKHMIIFRYLIDSRSYSDYLVTI